MIRELRREDRPALHRLLKETMVFSETEIDIALELIDTVLEKPEQKDYVVNVSEEGGEVVGYYCLGPTPATEGTFDLYWIATRPDMQGKGIGKQLDDHAVSLIRSRRGRLLVAETSSRPTYEKTRKFYLARGYAEVARVGGYYRPGDDLVVYAKYVS